MASNKPRSASTADENSNLQQNAKEAFELVKLRNFFYRDNYRRLVAATVFLIVLLLFMSYWVFYLITHRPAPQYFATNIQGGLTQLIPMNQPNVTTAALSNWAARGISAALTFNYVQYRDQLELAKDTYFTPEGGQQFDQQLQNTNDLDAVIQGKFVVTSQPGGAPQLLWQGVVPAGTYQGRYGWRVELPVVITAQNGNTINKRTVDAIVTIVRSSVLVDNTAVNMDGSKGIGIAQVLIKSLAAPTTTSV